MINRWKTKFNFMFSREHRAGIIMLILLIISLQIIIFYIDDFQFNKKNKLLTDNNWIKTQKEIDSLRILENNFNEKIYPFNPNLITDYKGYKLEMSVAEIDRLHKFRNSGKFINSATQFQNVTKVSNQWIKKYSPYFKFPKFINNNNNSSSFQNKNSDNKSEKIIQKDINAATKEDLIAVYGIGEKLSEKILLEKERLGAFVSLDQIGYIWGITPEALQDVKRKFTVSNNNLSLKKFNVNTLSSKELAKFPYFSYSLIKEIITHRSMHGDFTSLEQIIKLYGFPIEKKEIIALYLEF